MAKVSVKSKVGGRSSIFKTIGLLALIAFTFYFIYNYLATGSFSLKPRASEIATSDGSGACATRDQAHCVGGCNWTKGPDTTKTVTAPKTSTIQVDCTNSDCQARAHGCAFTTTTVTTGYTNQATYECSEQPGLGAAKCNQLGFSWVQTGIKRTPITTTEKNCDGSWANTVTTNVTETVPVAGTYSCTGTPINAALISPNPYQILADAPECRDTKFCGSEVLEARFSNEVNYSVKGKIVCIYNLGMGGLTPGYCCPKATPILKNGACVAPDPIPPICSAGQTQCSTDGKSVEVCSGNGKWQTSTCPVGCSINGGVAGCVIPPTPMKSASQQRCEEDFGGIYCKSNGQCSKSSTNSTNYNFSCTTTGGKPLYAYAPKILNDNKSKVEAACRKSNPGVELYSRLASNCDAGDGILNTVRVPVRQFVWSGWFGTSSRIDTTYLVGTCCQARDKVIVRGITECVNGRQNLSNLIDNFNKSSTPNNQIKNDLPSQLNCNNTSNDCINNYIKNTNGVIVKDVGLSMLDCHTLDSSNNVVKGSCCP